LSLNLDRFNDEDEMKERKAKKKDAEDGETSLPIHRRMSRRQGKTKEREQKQHLHRRYK
jgi:hypothetical protein